MSDNKQQTNSQAQAGAASQLIVNIFFVTTDGQTWTVKPIAFHVDRATAPAANDPATESGATQVDTEVKAERASNAQGQGLTVLNELDFVDVLSQAIKAAAEDQDIQKALDERR
ncbi:MAG: hypothetical protein M1598_08115 [Actinobacteria bacterium]|nr:hypothetical protein [Actinomycetota bacterium]